MNVDDSVTCWIDGLKDGSEESAQQLWERYFTQLLTLARDRLPRNLRRDFDEEDVALSAFFSLCEGVRLGKFPDLDDRNNLWSLLVVITARKAMRRMRSATAQKRGAGKVMGESVLNAESDEGPGAAINQVIGRDPTPEFALQVCEESERLLQRLPDDEMRKLALLKMEGVSNREAAKRLDCGLRTIERRLGLIRNIWSHSEK
jgi:DNA-directed RNA polymerase specialized sigma24 family protein